MAITKYVVTTPYYTNLPSDVSVNTFYFASVAVPDAVETGLVCGRLEVFYANIDTYLSPILKPLGSTIKVYNMADPEPRVPVRVWDMAARGYGNAGMPEEVAVCLSYSAAVASGVPAARRRGRIYLGPLSNNAYDPGSSSMYSEVAGAMRTALAAQAAVLADQSETSKWCVYSPTDGIARNIIKGFVDDSYDTMRSRGRRAIGRTLWVGQP